MIVFLTESLARRIMRFVRPMFLLGSVLLKVWVQEEDFCTNLYNRSLLRSFDAGEICTALEAALDTVKEWTDTETAHSSKALVSRLEYREALLKAMMTDGSSNTVERTSRWHDCSKSFDTVIATYDLGVEVPESFSPKIQRRLASSVPPRPIMQTEFGDTSAFLERLHEDGLVVEGVLKCDKLSSVVVSQSPSLRGSRC